MSAWSSVRLGCCARSSLSAMTAATRPCSIACERPRASLPPSRLRSALASAPWLSSLSRMALVLMVRLRLQSEGHSVGGGGDRARLLEGCCRAIIRTARRCEQRCPATNPTSREGRRSAADRTLKWHLRTQGFSRDWTNIFACIDRDLCYKPPEARTYCVRIALPGYARAATH